MKEKDRKQFHHNNPTLQFKLLKVPTYSSDIKATGDHLGELPQQEHPLHMWWGGGGANMYQPH